MGIRTPEDLKEVMEGAIPEFADRIAPVYEALNWRWAPDGEVEKAEGMTDDEVLEHLEKTRDLLYIPGPSDIASRLFSLVSELLHPERMAKNAHNFVCTGGLAVFYETDMDKKGKVFYNCGIEFRDDFTLCGDDPQPDLELVEGGKSC